MGMPVYLLWAEATGAERGNHNAFVFNDNRAAPDDSTPFLSVGFGLINHTEENKLKQGISPHNFSSALAKRWLKVFKWNAHQVMQQLFKRYHWSMDWGMAVLFYNFPYHKHWHPASLCSDSTHVWCHPSHNYFQQQQLCVHRETLCYSHMYNFSCFVFCLFFLATIF